MAWFAAWPELEIVGKIARDNRALRAGIDHEIVGALTADTDRHGHSFVGIRRGIDDLGVVSGWHGRLAVKWRNQNRGERQESGGRGNQPEHGRSCCGGTSSR